MTFEEFRALISGDLISYAWMAFGPIGEEAQLDIYMVLSEPYLRGYGDRTQWVIDVMNLKNQHKTQILFDRQRLSIVKSLTDDT